MSRDETRGGSGGLKAPPPLLKNLKTLEIMDLLHSSPPKLFLIELQNTSKIFIVF